MTVVKKLPYATSDAEKRWREIDFRKAEKHVKKLQDRIAKAYKQGEHKKVRALQRELTSSFCAKALAVKQVSQKCRGRKSPGIDGATWLTAEERWEALGRLKRIGYKAQPLKRVYIPKSGGKMRPISMPIMRDRAMQMLYKLALDPIAELTADRHSYAYIKGDSPRIKGKRNARAAVKRCVKVLSTDPRPEWILGCDIKGCFDNILHDWTLTHIPIDKDILQMFLKSGYMEDGKLFPTERGVPQGGTISATISNMVLDGLETMLKAKLRTVINEGKVSKPKRLHLVRYADDIIITGYSKEFLRQSVQPMVEAFLAERGLELSIEKTTVTHVTDGFDFLGFHIQEVDGVIHITPEQEKVDAFLDKLRSTVEVNSELSPKELSLKLKSMVTGKLNYYRGIVSDSVLHDMEKAIRLCLVSIYHDTHNFSLFALPPTADAPPLRRIKSEGLNKGQLMYK